MRQVVFKSYMGFSKNGEPSFYDCSAFDADDLVEMLAQPLTLTKVSFRVGHALWSFYLGELFNQKGGGILVANAPNMAKYLASIGYRVLPEKDEIRIT